MFKIISQLSPEFAKEGVIVPAGGAATIARNTPTKAIDVSAATWTGGVSIMADGDGNTTERFAGIAKSASTDTAAAAGTVSLWLPLPGMLYSGAAKSAAAADTAAEIAILFGKSVVFDLTSTVWSVDTAAADAAVNCVVIMGGDPNTSTVNFVYKNVGTILGSNVTTT